MKTLFIITTVLLSLNEVSYANFSMKNFDPLTLKMHESFCSGRFDSFNQLIKSLDIKKSKNLGARLMYIGTKEGQDNDFMLANKVVEAPETPSEVEKILAVNGLLMANHSDFIRIKKLLNFKSNDKIIESYRLFFEGNVDFLIGHHDMAYNKIKNAMDNLPFADPFVLISLYSTALNIKNFQKQMPADYFKLVEKMPDTNSLKYLMKANNLALRHGWETQSEQISSLFERAYELCPYDQAVALSYASVLRNGLKTEKAKKILLDIINNNKYYYPAVDIYLMMIYFESNDPENSKKYLNKAKQSIRYLTKDENAAITYVESHLAPNNSSNALSRYVNFFMTRGLIFVLVTALILVIIFRKKFKKRI